MDSLPQRSFEAMKRQATGGRKNRLRPSNLREQVDPMMCKAYSDASAEIRGLWPTPTASDRGRTAINPIMTKNGTIRHQNKAGGQSYARLDQVAALLPTPTASDYKGARTPETLARAGRKPSNSLCDTVAHFEQKTFFATPQARDFRTGQKERFGNPERSNNLNDQIGGQLNPDWVEWLMGVPQGWTNADAPNVNAPYAAHWFDAEPDIPRTTASTPHRADRLQALGNMVVPYQFYPIAKAIVEIEGMKTCSPF